MLTRALGTAALALTLAAGPLAAQGAATGKEPVSHGRKLSEWIADLKAPAPQTRNAAAYEISGMGPAAAAAVPALIESLDDPIAAVRFPVTVALGEIGHLTEGARRLLLEALRDAHPEIRQAAATALGKRGELKDAALGPVLQALEDANDGVQIAAARALMEWDDPGRRSSPAWPSCCKTPTPRCRPRRP